MIRSTVVVLWRHGLHLRPAAALVKRAADFHSTVVLRCGEKVADLRSILSVLALCAGMGTGLVVEAAGDDEQAALQAVVQLFAADEAANVGSLMVVRPPSGETFPRGRAQGV